MKTAKRVAVIVAVVALVLAAAWVWWMSSGEQYNTKQTLAALSAAILGC